MTEWTVMVYMAGDNNLSLEMAYAIEQIRSVTIERPDLKLYVYYDGFSTNVPTLYCDFSDPANPVSFYRSQAIEGKLLNAANDYNENSAEVNNIINFIYWCLKGHSAEEKKLGKYAFIFSGHSFGFLNWGLYKDEKADFNMTHSDIRYMLERITSPEAALRERSAEAEERYRRRTGREWSSQYRNVRNTEILGKAFDLIGFDSCVMSTLEIASQFGTVAKTMVASEGSIPNAGWNYAQLLLGRISSGELSDPKAVSVSFVEEFIKQQNKFALADISVDLAAWDLAKLEPLKRAFGQLAGALLESLQQKEKATVNQMRRLLVHVHWECQTYLMEQHIDLGDFCELLVKEIDLLKTEIAPQYLTKIGKVRKAAEKVLAALRKCILITGHSGSDYQFSNGVSLFFPWSLASYRSARADYERLAFIKNDPSGKLWNEFLQFYLSEITCRGARPLTPLSPGKAISKTVVYESYAGLYGGVPADGESLNGRQAPEGDRQPPEGDRQPPEGDRQPPEGDRQPPEGDRLSATGNRQPPEGSRMFSEINSFLSKFRVIKNVEANWNRAGFRSEQVLFVSQRSTGKRSTAARERGRLVVEILQPRFIEEKVRELARLLEDEATRSGGEDKHKYKEILQSQTSDLAKRTKVEVFKRLSGREFEVPTASMGAEEIREEVAALLHEMEAD
jgi:hypothetical protein